jgi:teichuronic acid biosynthesis glycosyltransferase TuaH
MVFFIDQSGFCEVQIKHVENILILFGANSRLEWGRSYQLAKAFHAIGHNVLYIDLPEFISRSFNKIELNSSKEFDIFKPRWGLPISKIRFLRSINKNLISSQVLKYLDERLFMPTILWIYSPYEPNIAKEIASKYKVNRVVYDCADDRVAYANTESGHRGANFVDKLEKEISSFCTCIISITDNLKKAKEHLHHLIHVIPNGIDCEMFNPHRKLDKPEPYNELTGKIVLYVGTIGDWIDQDIVVRAASRYPDLSFVFVGPIRVDIRKMKEYCNIFLLGQQEYFSIPAYIAYSDLCIVPFKNTNITKVSDSLKSLQYLSMVKPVLSTQHDGLNNYSGLIHVASSSIFFVDMIEVLLSSNPSFDLYKYKQVMKSYSWLNLAKEALKLINSNA